MKKKFILIMSIILLASSFTFAGDTKFLFGGLDQNPAFTNGIVPSYLNVGVGYEGISLLPNNTTQLQFLAGGGSIQRKFFQDEVTGISSPDNHNIVSYIILDSKLNLIQGFLEDDILKFNLGVKGGYEYHEEVHDSVIFPDLIEERTLYSYFTSGLLLNLMDDQLFTQDGFKANLQFTYGPSFMNNTADFYSANLDLQFAKTLFEIQSTRNGRNLFSVVLVDRFATSYTDGDAVPTYFQKSVSMGRRVRGFTSYTYNTNLNFVNNLDIRLSTFEITETPMVTLLPRFNFFFDAGYAMLDYLNTNIEIDSEDSLLMSTGVQATVSISDFIDLGYQLAYLLKGNNYNDDESKLIGSITFFLDF